MRKSYRDEYVTRQGRVVYAGVYYIPAGPGIGRQKALMAALSAAALAFTVGMGSLNNPGGRSLWVMLPYGFQLLAAALLPVSTVNFWITRRPLTHYEYDRYYLRIRTTALLAAGLGGLTAIADIANTLSLGLAAGPEIPFVGLACAATLCQGLLLRIHGRVTIETRPSRAPEGDGEEEPGSGE